MASVHIVYGYTEGRWHGKRFRRALKRRGYNLSRSITKADIVLGHSGGCYDIPALRKDQLLVLINPPYWPERSITERAAGMVRQIIRSLLPSRHVIFNIRKTIRNVIYFVIRRRHNKRIAERTLTFKLEQEIKHYKSILVRNHNDPWLTPDLHKLKDLNPHLHIERLPGDHDDCWINPNAYIDLIEGYRT